MRDADGVHVCLRCALGLGWVRVTRESRWQKTPRKLRESVIANLVHDANDCDELAADADEGTWVMCGEDADEARARARAFRAAAAALRKAARP
jgi:hypothetical protein